MNLLCEKKTPNFNNDNILQSDNVLSFDDFVKKNKLIKSKERPVITQAADPIKDKAVIHQIEEYLISHGRYGYRNWLIFFMGINIGRRCGDLLSIKVKTVFDGYKVKESIAIREQKTQKVTVFYLAPELQEAIYNYLMSLEDFSLEDYLFKSQKGQNITRKSYWRILKNIREDLDLNFRLSTHSMRKSWAYHLYTEYVGVSFPGGYDIVDQLQYMLGHSSRLMTLRDLGINAEVSKKLYFNNVLGGIDQFSAKGISW